MSLPAYKLTAGSMGAVALRKTSAPTAPTMHDVCAPLGKPSDLEVIEEELTASELPEARK